jgi:parvulin-like peptidyl-prolyl isomerase
MSAARALAISLALACGCDRGEQARDRPNEAGALGQGVVATVNGAPITLRELQLFVDRSGLSPRAALERLEAELILAGEAQRRGYAETAPVDETVRQAEVQALLIRDIESIAVGPEELAAAYAGSGERFDAPERRLSTHVLAALPKQPTTEQEQAAERFAREAIQRLDQSSDPRSTLAALKQTKSALFTVTVEQLPPTARNGPFVAEYMSALFSTSAPGVVPQPARTMFGWHAIVVTEIQPPHRVDREDAERELKQELELAARKRALEQLVRKLQGAARISYERSASSALATLEL